MPSHSPPDERAPHPRPARRHWPVALATGIVAGALVGGLMMSIAWEHNPQGEFHEAGVIHWGSWLAVGMSWALVVGVPLAVVAYVVRRAGEAR